MARDYLKNDYLRPLARMEKRMSYNYDRPWSKIAQEIENYFLYAPCKGKVKKLMQQRWRQFNNRYGEGQQIFILAQQGYKLKMTKKGLRVHYGRRLMSVTRAFTYYTKKKTSFPTFNNVSKWTDDQQTAYMKDFRATGEKQDITPPKPKPTPKVKPKVKVKSKPKVKPKVKPKPGK